MRTGISKIKFKLRNESQELLSFWMNSKRAISL